MHETILVTQESLGLHTALAIGHRGLFFLRTASKDDVVHLGNRCHAIKLHEPSGLNLFKVSLVLRRFLSSLDDGYLIEDRLHNHLIETLLDESIGLGQLIDVVGWVRNQVPVVFRGHSRTALLTLDRRFTRQS